jgi:hypothetical protein
MPFVTLAYMLRGVDLEAVFIVMIKFFIFMQILNCSAILVAVSNKLKISMYISTFIIMIMMFFLYCSSFILGYGLVYENSLTNVNTRQELYISFFFEGIILAIFICGSIALLSPPTSNRVFPFRVLLTVILLASFLFVFSGITSFSVSDGLEVIVALSVMVLIFIILLTVCERDQWSLRIRRSLPKSLFLRILLFPFYTGAACGIVWFFIVVLILGCVELFRAIFLYTPSNIHLLQFTNKNNESGVFFICGYLIFAFNYGITAMLIRGYYFKKLNSKYVIVIASGLLLVFTLGSMLLYFFVMICLTNNFATSSNPFDDYSNNFISALNPFCDFGEEFFRIPRIIGMMYWFIVLLIPLVRWYKNRLGTFNPDVKEPISYAEAREIVKNIELQIKQKK